MYINPSTRSDIGELVDDKNPPPPPSYPPTKGDWIAYRSSFTNLYWLEDKPLPEVMLIMRQRYNFKATYILCLLSPLEHVLINSENVCTANE